MTRTSRASTTTGPPARTLPRRGGAVRPTHPRPEPGTQVSVLASSVSPWRCGRLLQLFLGPQLVGVAALLLAAVLGARGQTGVADSADLLVLVVLLRKHHQRRLNDAATQAQHQVKGRLCWGRRSVGVSPSQRGWQALLRGALARHACRPPGPGRLRADHEHGAASMHTQHVHWPTALHCLPSN